MNLTFPAVFRSYKGRDTPNCTIWEAIRITTADPQLFYPIYIMKTTEKETVARTERYISAEFGHNNPIRLLIHEAEQVFRSWPVYACVVSIGTGRSMNESFSLKDIPKDEPQRLHGVFMRMVKDTERDHQEFGLAIQDDGDKDYFRFNVDEGILDGWSYDWTQKEHFIKATERYAPPISLLSPLLYYLAYLLLSSLLTPSPIHPAISLIYSHLHLSCISSALQN